MTKNTGDTRGLSAPDRKLLADIHTVGWHTTGVFAQQNEEGPEWAFSVGLFQSFAHPEVILFGLPLERCTNIVNVIGTAVKEGKRYECKGTYTNILQEPYRCAFREVHESHYRDHIGFALWFYEDDPFPVMQCFWTDKQGLFPWDEECNDYAKHSQPLLYKPKVD